MGKAVTRTDRAVAGEVRDRLGEVHDMAGPSPSVTIVNHASIDIGATADTVWRAIVEDYVDAGKFADLGYEVSPLDDRAAIHGGYRLYLDQDGVIDDRSVYVTERDETARRLSLFARYHSDPHGLRVCATYQAHDDAGGARYTLDCHSMLDLGATADDMEAFADTMRTDFGDALVDYLKAMKARLEEKCPATTPSPTA